MTTTDAPALNNLSTEALTQPFDLVLDLRIALRRLGREFPMDEQALNAQTDAAAALLTALGVEVARPGAAHGESTR